MTYTDTNVHEDHMTEDCEATHPIRDARDWIADCFDDVDAWELSDDAVWQGIERHYEGGVDQFMRDGQY